MPNDNDLIERYLYAITRHLPSAQRSDVAEELRTLISDMLDERCGSLPPTAKDVRVVLTELGTPGEMVRKYTSGEGECLIGQPYYAQYLYVLKIVWPASQAACWSPGRCRSQRARKGASSEACWRASDP